jgi:DNA polymerase-3 subunit delta
MLINTTALNSHLQQPLLPVYIICGSEDYFIQDTKVVITRVWRQQCLQQANADALEKQSLEIGRDGLSWESLATQLQSYSLFAEKTLYQINYPKGSLDKTAQRILISFAESNSTHATVIVTGNQLKHKSLATLEKHDQIGLIPVWPLKPNEFVRWVDHQLKNAFPKTASAAAQLIARFCHNNPYAVRQVIAKLKLTQPSTAPLSEESISQQLSNQCEFQVFELSDACLGGDTQKVLQILTYLRSNPAELNLLLWVISKDIRTLVQLHNLCKIKPFTQACQQLSIWRNKTSLYQSTLKRCDIEQLNHLLIHCHNADKLIKTGQSMVARHSIEHMAFILATGKEQLIHE